jgi:phage-related baseplate assembly protein
MARDLSDNLDLSRLPDPTLVPVDYEAILEARKTSLVENMAEAGIDYDERDLEFDPGVILEEVDAGREMLARQAINDAGRANMLAFTRGPDLDNLAALFGIKRAIVGLDQNEAPIYESDARLRRRVQLAPEAFATAGSGGGYIFHALKAHPNIADASVTNPEPGVVIVTVMSDRADPEPTTEEVNAVRNHLFAEDVKPITDILTVQGAEVLEVDIVANLRLYGGPDASVVLADARKNLEAFLAINKRLGRDLNLTAWLGRLYRDTVHSVVPVQPVADVVATPAQVVWVKSITLNAVGTGE